MKREKIIGNSARMKDCLKLLGQAAGSDAGVLITGEKTSAINIYTAVDENTFTFSSIGREINGEPQPNIEEIRVVRKKITR